MELQITIKGTPAECQEFVRDFLSGYHPDIHKLSDQIAGEIAASLARYSDTLSKP